MRSTLKIISKALQFLLYKWVLVLINLIHAYIRIFKKRHRRKKLPHRIKHNVTGDCAQISAVNYKRADPLIYSQHYLIKLGLAVTWDNPDIQLFEGSIPVPSHQLKPFTTYRVRARIWNGSTEAPVVGMPVKFSYLDFGAGTISIPIADSMVNVGVLGGANQPAFTEVNWTTPAAGHYCIQVRLIWNDDINPENNLGQENTNVVNPSSPAKFDFKVRNDDSKPHRYLIEVDTYELPHKIDCKEKERIKRKDQRGYFINRNRKENFPIPPNWQVTIFNNNFLLDPGNEMKVEGEITPPDNFVGTKAFNFNVYTIDKNKKLVGGVTIYVEKK